MQPSHATLESASRNAARFVMCSPRASIPGAQRDTIDDLRGESQDDREQLRARLVGLLLGVVQRAEDTDLTGTDRVEVEQHRGGHQRAGEAASPGLIGTGDEPHAQRAVELEQPASRGADRLRRGGDPAPLARLDAPFVRLDAPFARPEAPFARLEEADPVRGPVREERGTDDPFTWDWAPETTVVRVRHGCPPS